MHFTEDQIAKALETFHDLKSATKVVRKLGYPSTKQLYKWIKKEGQPHQERKHHRIINTPEHPPHAPFNVKLEAIRRCYEMGEPMISVAKDIGYTYASIYYWYQDYKKIRTYGTAEQTKTNEAETGEGKGSFFRRREGAERENPKSPARS
jgi:transposase-like protein